MISLIPMAGRGSRFKKNGYNLPKPFIPIMGMPMFVASIHSFPLSDKHIIICQNEFVDRYSIVEKMKKFLPECQIISVNGITEGQASTCLLAESQLNVDEALMISSCDYQLVFDQEMYDELLNDSSIDVIVWTFEIGQITKNNPEEFAYCRTNGQIVTEIVEKQTISQTPHLDPAVVGTFTYRQASDFVWAAKKMIAKNIRVNGEFYIGTSINQLIEMGKKVAVFPVKKFISFGDPFELQLYQYWEDYFFQEDQHPYNG